MLRPRTQSSATVPGGSDTQVQFNNAGAFGGSPYFMLDTVSNIFQYDTGNVAVRVSDAGQATLIAGEVVLDCKGGTAYIGDYAGAGSNIMLKVDSGNNRVELNSYFCLTNDAKQAVFKSPNGHYWHLQVDNGGALNTTDLGTSLP